MRNKILREVFIVSSLILTSGCLGDNNHTNQSSLEMPNLNGRPVAINIIRDSWGKLIAHCPGLVKYQNDLKFVGIDDLIDPILHEMSRVEVKYKVSDSPEIIPNRYRANSHMCGYGISANGKTLRIQKTPCVSVCINTEYSGGTDYIVTL